MSWQDRPGSVRGQPTPYYRPDLLAQLEPLQEEILRQVMREGWISLALHPHWQEVDDMQELLLEARLAYWRLYRNEGTELLVQLHPRLQEALLEEVEGLDVRALALRLSRSRQEAEQIRDELRSEYHRLAMKRDETQYMGHHVNA
ncbi:MAG TPA: hypothetical protein VKU87_08220 [Thermomicrobiaceae bacterium]|nr:hypothetical protein [Thermomicrobiaceae bacterium]